MKKFLSIVVIMFTTLTVSGCSVFGKSSVEIAPYKVLEKEAHFELRHYESLVLITAPMTDQDDRNSPFSKLFGYISGKNEAAQEIAMTAPVFMDQMQEQAQDNNEVMAFVLPATFSFKDAPQPQDPSVKLEEVTDYTVATITFSGRLQQENIQKHKALLEGWVESKQFNVIGPAKTAGYNAPFTLPAMRRNEVFIPVEKPSR